MKIQCPVCETEYNLRPEQFPKPVVRANCKRCGSILFIHRDTGKVQIKTPSPKPDPKPAPKPVSKKTSKPIQKPPAGKIQKPVPKPPVKKIPKPPSIPPSLTVQSAGKAGRNYPAIIAVVAVVGLTVFAAYYFLANPIIDFIASFGASETMEVKGPNRVKVSRAFVRRNKKVLADVGKIKNLTLLDDETMNWKGKQMARVTLQVEGSQGLKRLQILLLKEDGQWRAFSTGEEPKVAKARTKPKPTKKPPVKAPPAVLGKGPQKIRLPPSFTDKQMANFVSTKPDVRILSINGCRSLSDLTPIASLSNLTFLNLARCQKIDNLAPLTKLTNLKQLNIHGCESINDLTPLTKMSSLRELHMPPTTSSEDLDLVLSHLPQLEKLVLENCPLVTDISPVGGLTNLSHLIMNSTPEISDITPLAGLTRLRVLEMKDTGVMVLNALVGLSNLEWLYLDDSEWVTDISPLKNLTNLKILSLSGCKGVSDIRPLGQLTKLRILSLKKMEEINDISALSRLTQLRNLYLQGCKKINQKQISELKKLLPRCSIEYRSTRYGQGHAVQ